MTAPTRHGIFVSRVIDGERRFFPREGREWCSSIRDAMSFSDPAKADLLARISEVIHSAPCLVETYF